MREGMTGKFRDVFSRSNESEPERRPEDCDPEKTMVYEPGQREALMKEDEIGAADTQFDFFPGEERPKTIYEKANEGDIEEARHEVILISFGNALFFDRSSVGRVREDSVDPILAYHHLKQAKELGFPEYKQMRDEFMESIPEALRRSKIESLPEGADPKYKDPKAEAQKYILEIEKEIVDEMDEQIAAAA